MYYRGIKMKIVLVIDQYDSATNGTTISARRFARELREHGNEVKIVACGSSNEQKIGVSKLRFPPIAENIIKSQGMELAYPNKKKLKFALEWADVAHFMMPFALSYRGLRLAEKMGVPHTAAFHVQPENITFSLGIGNSTKCNKFIYDFFRDKFYNRFSHIHCPSEFIASQLKQHGYTAKLHVISNGISPTFCYRKSLKPKEFENKFIITTIGRLSAEKRHDVLISAVNISKYSDSIQLVFAGQGPKKRDIVKLSKSLHNPLILNFYNENELHELLSYSDLYVHPSDVEIEAISCIEAFASGLVPIIANSERSATPQFAIDERSLFEAGNPASLAKKIDYWIEHKENRFKSELLYSEKGKEYHLKQCVSKIENMFIEAIEQSEYKIYA